MIKQTYNLHKETIHNFIWRLLQTFGKEGITFLIFFICAKLLDPYTFGIYNYVLTIIFLLVVFGDFGISTATSKYVAEYNVNNKNRLKSILYTSLLLILGLTITVTILTLLFGKYFLGDKYIYILYTIPLIFLMPLSSLYDGIYRGLKKFKQLAIISLLIGIFSLGFVYILIKQYGLVGALISQNLFYLILVLGLGIGYKEFNLKADKIVMKKIFYYSLIIGFANIAFLLYTKIDILILKQFDFIVEIGYYEIVNRLFLALSIPTMILGQVIAPDIIKDLICKRYSIVRKKLIKSIPIFIFLGIFLSIILYLIFPPIIKIFLPEYYTKDFLMILTILLFYFPIKLYANFLVNGFITPGGYAKIIIISGFIVGVLNILLDYIFVIKYGFIGIFFSTSLVYLIHTLILGIYLYTKLLSSERIENEK